MKPIREQIEWVRRERADRFPSKTDDETMDAILSTLRAVESAERELPEEPHILTDFRDGLDINDNPNIGDVERDEILAHIDALRNAHINLLTKIKATEKELPDQSAVTYEQIHGGVYVPARHYDALRAYAVAKKVREHAS